MPILTRRHDHIKVYRPNGTRYSEARSVASANNAAALAIWVFREEFGYAPKQEETVIEVVGVTGQWIATVYEVKGFDGPCFEMRKSRKARG